MTALVAIIPFLRIKGNALLRVDIPALTLELVGHRFRIEEFYLVWLLTLWLIVLFLLLALTLGRIWCGWACPQTALSDLADWLDKKRVLKPFRLLGYLLVSLWAGGTVVWYFIPPFEFFRRLRGGELGPWPTGALLTIAVLVCVDLVLVRRLFCREFCPYGRFQTVLTDKGTLTLQAHPDHSKRCLDCKACLRVCPTEIDIRKGFQIECINCARCLDACRQVMAKRGEEGIIRYTFGERDLGWSALLSVKTVGLTLLLLALGGIVLYLASHRATASFKIGRSVQLASRLTESGRQFTFFSGSIANRREGTRHFALTVRSGQGEPLAIKGPAQLELAGSEKRDLNLAVESPVVTGPDPLPITFTLLSAEDGSRLEVRAFLTPASVPTKSSKE